MNSMKILLSFFTLLSFINIGFGQKSTDNTLDSKEMNEALNEAMMQLENAMDSVDLSSLFSNDALQFDMLFDTSQMQMLMDGNINDLFTNLFPEGMESDDFQSLMQQGMMMFEQMDMQELESLMEGIDQNEINKLFEGLDFSELEKMFNSVPTEEKEKLKNQKGI